MKEQKNYAVLSCQDCLNGAGLSFEFSMAFQPILDVQTNSVFSYEALARGKNGESAAWILSQVNENNRYRFDQAIRVRAIDLAARLNLSTHLSINFLPNAVYRPDTCIRATLEAAKLYRFPIERIIFEVTEGENIEDKAHLVGIIKEYKRQGFKTAIDDFGAGYSGLNLLAEFQPDFIKIDLALVRNIHQDRVKQAILHGIMIVCEEVGIGIIAEGVETKEEMEFLARSGVRYMQGFYFAKPEFERLPLAHAAS
ncbi:MAG: EAL domain-containing protein [Chloroherpetonaceae bacterium]|nr:EAL domain-containing protein [Chloroherpetonaceae bacterium]MDW8436893.1 EAL domain-containing protein [Chloroherpetonaceae bacterium]